MKLSIDNFFSKVGTLRRGSKGAKDKDKKEEAPIPEKKTQQQETATTTTTTATATTATSEDKAKKGKEKKEEVSSYNNKLNLNNVNSRKSYESTSAASWKRGGKTDLLDNINNKNSNNSKNHVPLEVREETWLQDLPQDMRELVEKSNLEGLDKRENVIILLYCLHFRLHRNFLFQPKGLLQQQQPEEEDESDKGDAADGPQELATPSPGSSIQDALKERPEGGSDDGCNSSFGGSVIVGRPKGQRRKRKISIQGNRRDVSWNSLPPVEEIVAEGTSPSFTATPLPPLPFIHINTKKNINIFFFFSKGDPRKEIKVAEEVGQGGFGKVFKGKKVKNPHQGVVAIKKMPHVERGTQFNNFKEVLFLKQLRHANVVDYFCCYTLDEELWLVTEFMQGGTLTEACKKAQLDEKAIAFVAKEMLSGIAFLHQNDCMHR